MILQKCSILTRVFQKLFFLEMSAVGTLLLHLNFLILSEDFFFWLVKKIEQVDEEKSVGYFLKIADIPS